MPLPSLSSRRAIAWSIPLAALIACRKAPEPDAYGHLEATETVVAAQSSGQLERFVPTEGSRIGAGSPAAIVDTTALVLQLQQIASQRAASSARVAEAGHQIAAIDAQATVAQRSYARARRLFDQQAATAQQLDQAEREYRTLVAQRAGAGSQRVAAEREASSTDARVAQVRDQIARSHVASPVSGTVLTTYVRVGEFVQVGQPLFKVADLDTMELRAYVTESQLTSVKIGQRARVSVDAGAGVRRAITGVVTWISAQAEFTPTPIQTRDERTNLVYAVKLRVPNTDGALKIGMPADVDLAAISASP
ncbi:MAG: HlyD family efflux transporter periplasmic adaptor subunit [bacterium]